MPSSKMLSYFLPITCQWDLQGLWVFKNHDEYYISESRNVLTCDWMFCLISDRKKMSSAAGLVHTCESKVSPWPGRTWLRVGWGDLEGVGRKLHPCGWAGGPPHSSGAAPSVIHLLKWRRVFISLNSKVLIGAAVQVGGPELWNWLSWAGQGHIGTGCHQMATAWKDYDKPRTTHAA